MMNNSLKAIEMYPDLDIKVNDSTARIYAKNQIERRQCFLAGCDYTTTQITDLIKAKINELEDTEMRGMARYLSDLLQEINNLK